MGSKLDKSREGLYDVMKVSRQRFGKPIGLKELNGDLFRGSYEGEELIATGVNTYVAFSDMPMAQNPFEDVQLDGDQVGEFIYLNANHIKSNQPNIADADCFKIAFARACIVRLGLVSKHFSPGAFYVNYTEVMANDDSYCNDLLNADTVLDPDMMDSVLSDRVK